MPTHSAIQLKDVSKKYKLYQSPKHRLYELLNPFGRKFHNDFWALDGINLSIKRGSTVGVIGRNGSGKSTLLQIISSIVKPTKGEIKTEGRISALLELGAGFNPSFTGRDNVLLNGALMGFTKKEMMRKMPEIESFAEIGEFIDQPVKIYSTGMFIRLAFAVAINVDPDILVIDEVLAVGDAKFQYKCYQKFREFQQDKKTIILVSHDLSIIAKHCDSAILIDEGKVQSSGKPNDVINAYYSRLFGTQHTNDDDRLAANSESLSFQDSGITDFLSNSHIEDRCIHRSGYNPNESRHGNANSKIIDYLISSKSGGNSNVIKSGEWLDIYMKVMFLTDVIKPMFGICLKTVDGVTVYATHTLYEGVQVEKARKGEVIVFKLSIRMAVTNGDYFIDLGSGEWENGGSVALDRRYGLINITVRDSGQFEGLTHLDSKFEVAGRIPASFGSKSFASHEIEL